ncbi:MAG: 10-formyltetrahydrofolate:L-methionyl-tRNA(fMet) N-formyltransferase [Candidatus Westeberhardia cardiocondylae]|nr:10-formyltetrahydrofolate:L-methionyl-tRNA(fMet) N-formyltransferase [Candidatus Westeberhardia cardiocondylae]
MFKKLRIIFAGTSQFSSYHLNELIHSKHKIIGTFTKPDCKSGRGKILTQNIIKKISQNNNIPIFQPKSSQDFNKWINTIKILKPDIMVVASYGIIIPKKILILPKFGCINVHASLLPKWRGAAPIQRSILEGDKKTGITIIQMNSFLDEGDIIYQKTCNIHNKDTSETLEKKLSNIGKKALIETLTKFNNKTIQPIKQNNNFATYAKKINKKESKINWKLSATQLDRYVKAFNPWPICYFTTNKKKIKIWESEVNNKTSSKTPGTILKIDKSGIHISTGHKILIIKTLQIENKQSTSFKNILNSPKNNWLYQGNIME